MSAQWAERHHTDPASMLPGSSSLLSIHPGTLAFSMAYAKVSFFKSLLFSFPFYFLVSPCTTILAIPNITLPLRGN